MKKTVYFPEIFEEIGKAKTRKEKIDILHKYRNVKGFYEILKLCYDPNIYWLISRKDIENLKYKDMDIADYDLAPATLFLLARRQLQNYTNLRNPPLKKEKILKLIAGHFSSLYYEEVELFKQLVAGRIQKKGITEKLIRDAFPGLLSDPVIPAKPKKKTKPATKKKVQKDDKKEDPKKEESKKEEPKKEEPKKKENADANV
jgi:hypothetical protein